MEILKRIGAVLGATFVVLWIAGTYWQVNWGKGAGDARTCDELKPYILDMAKEDGREIVAMYDVEPVTPKGENRFLDCTAGLVKWRNGDDSTLSFYLFRERGDMFYGYEKR